MVWSRIGGLVLFRGVVNLTYSQKPGFTVGTCFLVVFCRDPQDMPVTYLDVRFAKLVSGGRHWPLFFSPPYNKVNPTERGT